MPLPHELHPKTCSAPVTDVLLRLGAPADTPGTPRLLLVFAHPDDEVLAVGACLEHLTGSRLLTLTDGAPADGGDALHHGFSSLDAYRQARREELLRALADAGLDPAFAPPFPGQVPDQEAALHLVALTRAIAQEIEALRPEAVLTHPYEGGHPDHDACAFAVHQAVRLAAARHEAEPVAVLEAPFYHISDTRTMKTGAFLEHASPVVTRELSVAEKSRKRARLACFASQAETLAQFPCERELFRPAPAYNFVAPPHGGELLYERFGWGMEGHRFRELAAAALHELFPAGNPAQAGS